MSADPAAEPASLVLRLYVADNAPNSLLAQANLTRLCAGLSQPHTVEVVDVLQAPERAQNDGVSLTPTLVRLAPPPVLKFVGDLSDLARVRAVLGLPEPATPGR